VKACVEMMSGAAWVRERLEAAGWTVEIADARKVKALAPLAAKTDKSAWTAAHLGAMKCSA
jgi:hypothetical protein